jgi:hypothetical protein
LNEKRGLNIVSRYNVTAKGNAVLPLKCQIDSSGNRLCSTPDYNITGSVTSRSNLPQFDSALDPPPTTGGCTIESIYTPSYALDGITLTDLANSSADPRSAFFQFTLYAFHALSTNAELFIANPIDVSRVQNSPSAQTWHDSIIVSNKYNTYKCRWKYDYATNHLTLDHEWLCADKDPNSP